MPEGGEPMGIPALTIIQLLQEFVALHGEETEVAVAVPARGGRRSWPSPSTRTSGDRTIPGRQACRSCG
jgi:hypothetical protein